MAKFYIHKSKFTGRKLLYCFKQRVQHSQFNVDLFLSALNVSRDFDSDPVQTEFCQTVKRGDVFTDRRKSSVAP